MLCDFGGRRLACGIEGKSIQRDEWWEFQYDQYDNPRLSAVEFTLGVLRVIIQDAGVENRDVIVY